MCENDDEEKCQCDDEYKVCQIQTDKTDPATRCSVCIRRTSKKLPQNAECLDEGHKRSQFPVSFKKDGRVLHWQYPESFSGIDQSNNICNEHDINNTSEEGGSKGKDGSGLAIQ